LFAGLVFLLPRASQAADSPISYWKFDGSGVDSVGGNNGALTNGPLWTIGKIGQALQFGGNKYVNCGNNPGLSIRNAITVMAWVNGSGDGKIVNKARSYHAQGDYDLTKNYFALYVDNAGYPSGWKILTFTSPDNVWTHIAATYDGDWMRVYVNGEQVASKSIGLHTIDASGGNLGIGANLCGDNPGQQSFTGVLDEVRIYDHALSCGEIADAGAMVGNWRFDEGSGLAAADSAGSNNGALVNGPAWIPDAAGLSFNGINQYVNCENSPGLSPRNKITVMAWVNGNGSGKIVNKSRNYYSHGDYDLTRSSFTLYMDNGGWPGGYETIIFASPGNEWSHIAATYDGAWMCVYVDGHRVGRRYIGSHTIDASGGNLGIGANVRSDAAGSAAFAGSIEDVRIYDQALSPEAIADIAGTTIVNVNKVSGTNYICVVVPAISNDLILPADTYIDGKISSELAIKSALGEFEPGSFVVHAETNLNAVALASTDLARVGGGGTIASANVDIKVVKCWYQSGKTPGNSNKYKYFTSDLLVKDDALVTVSGNDNFLKVSGNSIKISDPLGVPGFPNKPTTLEFPVQDSPVLQPVNIPAGTNKQFLVTVYVPGDAAAGIYQGTISLNIGGTNIGNMTLKVEALPITLSNEGFTGSLYSTSTLASVGTISGDEKNAVQYAAELKNLKNHGVNPYCKQPLSSLTSVLDLREAAGINNQPLYYGGLTISSYGMDLGSLTSAVAGLVASASSYGIPQVYVYGRDEQDMNNPDNRAQIAAVHAAGAKVFCAQSPDKAAGIVDVLDLAIVYGDPDTNLSSLYHSYGHKIYSYAAPQGGDLKADVNRRNYGIKAGKAGYDGSMVWAYQSCTSLQNIWNDFAGPATYVFAYPTVNGVIDTNAWEGYREAFEDVRYVKTLQARIAKNPSLPAAIAATNYLQNLDWGKNLDTVRSEVIAYILQLP